MSAKDWEVVFSSVHDLIIIMDIDNRIIDANPATLKATGLTKEQIIGQLCYQIFHCTEKPPCNCPNEKLKKSLHLESYTMEMKALGRKYLITVAPVFDGEGKRITRVIHIAKDVTELRKAEAAHIDSEKKFEGIFQAAADGILLADIVDKKFVDANDAICKMLGYTRDELLQCNVMDIHPEKDLPHITNVFKKQVNGKILVASELPVRRKDGSLFYADISSKTVMLGDRYFLIGIFRDISYRLKTEQLLKAEKKLAQKYLDVASVMLVVLNTKGEITLINQKGCEILHIHEKDALGKNWFDTFIPKKMTKEIKSVFRQIMRADLQPVEYYKNKILSQNGEIRDIAFHNTILRDTKGIIIGLLSSGEDITEKIKAEKIKLKLQEEIQKNNKLKSLGILAGGIAHDFNNTLAAILGNIELAEIQTESTSEVYLLLAEVKKASIRAKDLTQQLLTFSKGGDPVKQTAVIGTIILDSANFVLHGTSIIADYRIPENLWQVDVDTGQISQVIQNIIINARHAMPDGGVIKIYCQNIEDITKESISLPTGQYIKLTIADSGAGIPKKYIDKIFDPYFSTKQKGSGLGLAICYSIIKKHNGNISVQSKTNKGTVFTIYLPASTKINHGLIPSKPDITTGKNKATIMVMDDEVIVRDMIKQMLLRSGHEVVLAENGQEAIEIYNEYYKSNQTIDVIIMDLTIAGGLGGKHTAPKILKIDPTAKIIIISGYANNPIMAHSQDYGFAASLAKPFQLAELNKIINEILE